MNNKIDFGNNVGYKINDYATKKKIVDYLLSNVEYFKFKFQNITSEDDLLKLKNLQYYISPNIKGDEYIFLSKKINNIYYNVIIKKDTIRDEKDINYNDLIIVSLKVRLCKNTYEGTIFDGKIVNLGGCSVFLINDCLMLYGKDISDHQLDTRFDKINSFLESSYIIDNNMNVIDFRLNKLNELSEIKDLVYNRMKKSVYDFDSILFSPKNKNSKYIFHLNNKKSVSLEKNLLGKKIDTDVIELFSKDENDELRRIGISHIPTIKCSKICSKHIFDKLTPIKCRLNTKVKKWEPIEIYLDENILIDKYSDIKDIMMNLITVER